MTVGKTFGRYKIFVFGGDCGNHKPAGVISITYTGVPNTII